MSTRFASFTVAALVALAPAAFVGCTSTDSPISAPTTVRLAVMDGADHGGRPFRVEMTQEVTSQPFFEGDVDGTGVAELTINPGQRELCWDITVNNITLPATQAHIHRAAPGSRGPIVLGLMPPGTEGASRGCAAGYSRDLLQEIIQSPEAFYVNVHNNDFPSGAIRAQLSK